MLSPVRRWLAAFAVMSAAWSAAPAMAALHLYTLAGLGPRGTTGDGGVAGDARIRAQCVTALPDGSVLVAGGASVRRIGFDGIITTVAGTGEPGFSGDGGPATRARIRGCGLAALPDGGFLLADAANNRVRRVDADGVITTVAGTGTSGYRGDGGPAPAAQLANPWRVYALAAGGMVIATHRLGGAVLRRVDAAGDIATLAGVTPPCGRSGARAPTDVRLNLGPLTVSRDGGLLLAETGPGTPRGCLLRIAPDGTVTTAADGLAALALAPTADGGALAFDGTRVLRLDPGGAITPLAGCTAAPCTTGDGPAASISLSGLQALAEGPDGEFFLADYQRVARVDTAGVLTTVARLGGVSLAGRPDGTLLLAHPDTVRPGGPPPTATDLSKGTVVEIAPGGGTRVVAGGGAGDPQPGMAATEVALHPSHLQTLRDGFAVFDSERAAVVMVAADGTIARVITTPGAEAKAFAVRADDSIAALIDHYPAEVRLEQLGDDGVWTPLAGGPARPAPGVPATSLTVMGGFAPLPDGGFLTAGGEGDLLRVGADGIAVQFNAAILRRFYPAAPLAPSPGGGALLATDSQLGVLRDVTGVTGVAGGIDAGFFGSGDGERAPAVDLGAGPAIADVAATPDGGVLIARDDRSGARVAWLAPDRTGRLAVAIRRASLGLARHGRIAIRTTRPAELEIIARRKGHAARRARATVSGGAATAPLPRNLEPGEYDVAVEATGRDGARAATHHRFLLGSHLPIDVARRLVQVGGPFACRRFSTRRVDCLVDETREGSNFTEEACAVKAVLLGRDGVIREREYGRIGASCPRRGAGAMFERHPEWVVRAREAPPL